MNKQKKLIALSALVILGLTGAFLTATPKKKKDKNMMQDQTLVVKKKKDKNIIHVPAEDCIKATGEEKNVIRDSDSDDDIITRTSENPLNDDAFEFVAADEEDSYQDD